MDGRSRKPKVFLSHSRFDVDLAKRLEADLRRCQIEPWRDEMDIRHGKPWLDAIFNEGIPNCDCILVYLTERSLNSAMVRKELDAAVLAQLRDSDVALLPYVDDEARRMKLRADIRALQVPVLNSGNYGEILPQIVAEVWRSFLERTIPMAVRRERVKRLEAELEVEKLRKASGDGIFSEQEEREFAYFFSRLNRQDTIEFQLRPMFWTDPEPIRSVTLAVSVISCLPKITDSEHKEYSDSSLLCWLREALAPEVNGHAPEDWDVSAEVTRYPQLADEFLLYGFVRRVHHDQPVQQDRYPFMTLGPSLHLVYTDKLERFKYWLSLNGHLPDRLVWSLQSVVKGEDDAEVSRASVP